VAVPPPPIEHHAAVEQPRPREERKPFVERRLSVGSRAPTASRMIWELTIDEKSASLVVTEQEAPGTSTIDRADREAKWTTTQTYSKQGPLRHVGDHLALDLESETESLFLRCWRRPIQVAAAGARRVPTPGRKGDCSDRGVWSPATTTQVDALVGGQGDALDDGQVIGIDGQHGNPLDETLWRFGAAPGIELVEEIHDCFQSTGLRLAK
jgi:hypothetical protein